MAVLWDHILKHVIYSMFLASETWRHIILKSLLSTRKYTTSNIFRFDIILCKQYGYRSQIALTSITVSIL